ncbi:MAG: chemotaxis protein CheR [Spirochaetes bacterium]|nr:chemotaxis protein CheR [Spirochaetota bacterium]
MAQAAPGCFTLSDELLARLGEFIEAQFGIKTPPSKKSLLEGRLSKRLRALGLDSFEAYWDYLCGEVGRVEEFPFFSDLVSTHKTEFFRERQHFETLTATVLPGLLARGVGSAAPLLAWSCGCSTGEEPYTLAMVLDDYRASRAVPLDFNLLATDVSEPAIQRALRAVYHEDTAAPIPEAFRRRYLLRGSDAKEGLVRIAPALRAQVRFRVLNLMDEVYAAPHGMHLIFFRNVLIYFEKAVQERIIGRLKEHLAPGGHLFLGHSESIFGFAHGLEQIEPTLYRKAP